ncbi:MAG: cation-translocating P-type ATPase [Methanobacteriaceae archaeon]|nr:cation-translocating P-type ATPase [Methanobacteriaceae archaeon]
MPRNNFNQQSVSCGCSTCEEILEEKKPSWMRKPLIIICISTLLMVTGLYLDFFTGEKSLAEILFLLVVIVAGYSIIKKGIKSVFKLKFNMNFLMTIAAAGAFLIGAGAEGASVLLLFFIAEFLEDYAGERARQSMSSIIKLAPQIATIKKGKQTIEVQVNEVRVDDVVVVKPGDKIPLDGEVLEGYSSVNQAYITGESIPVRKSVGSQVFAGTINEEGYLEIKVTKESEETVISRIIQLVKESQKNKSPIEAFIDKFASYYTPAVIILVVLVAALPSLVFGLSFDEWIYRALTLLVVSCPCALAISTPVSIVSAITSATRNGVLIKGGEYIEGMKNVDVIVFDKTGTLTKGVLEVTDIKSFNNYNKYDVLEIAASLESKSKHPLAKPIIRKAEDEKLELKTVSNFRSITGKGITGIIDDQRFYVGKLDLMNEYGDFVQKYLNKIEDQGRTSVLVGDENDIIGVIGLMDTIRENSSSVLTKLKNQNIKTVMLTGDNKKIAMEVGKNIGIDKCYADLLPEDKVKIIEELSEVQKHVAMVGDGVNDAPALARSNIGIAMGAAGSDMAIETADVALMNDDLSRLNYLIQLSHKTMQVIKQNITISILIKTSFAVLAVLGMVTLWMAVAIGDMGLSLLVILNALRIANKD